MALLRTPSVQQAVPVFYDKTSLAGGAALEEGYIYRETGVVNVLAKAQGDTSAHAAGIVGVGSASLGLSPLVGRSLAQFSDLPTVGSIAYLSTATAGKLQVAVSATSPPLGIVRTVVSGTVPYTAQVEWGVKSQTAGVDMCSSLLTETAAMLGGSPSDYGYMFDDMDEMVDLGSGNWRPKLSKFNTGADFNSRVGPSVASLEYRYLSGTWPANAFGAILAKPWLMQAKLYCAIPGASADAFMLFQGVGGTGCVSVVFPPTTCPDQKLIGGYSAESLLGGAAYPSSYVVLGERDDLTRTWSMRSLGDGTVQWRLDGGAWTAPRTVSISDSSGSQWAFGCYQMYVYPDYYFFAYKVR